MLSSLVPRFPLGLDSPCLSNSFITGPLCNVIKVHKTPMSHEFPNNFRAPGRKSFLGGYLKEQKWRWKACSPPYWHGDCWYCCTCWQSFSASQEENGKLEHCLGVKRQVSVEKNPKFFLIIDCVHLNGKSRQGDWGACSSHCQVSWFLILEQSSPHHRFS